MQKFEFQYGSQDKGFKLTGVADFKFGKHPRFDGVLSGGQIDLDRALAGGDGSRLPPAAAIRKLAQLAAGAFRPTIPIQIGIGIDQVTLGGDAVQNLRGDISTDAKGWNLDRFEFRAPGFTQVRLSGHLAVDDERVAFTGPAEIKTNDAKALTAWLEGHPAAGQGDLRPMSLRGELTLGSDKIAVERLTAEFDRKTITGNFAYVFAAGSHPARLDAALKAPELDIDAALGFGNALLAGSDIARPHDMTIAADIGHATVAGLDARDLSARLKVDAGGLQIDRLSVADLGGAAFSASGRIATAPSPQGSMQVDLDAPDMTPVVALLSRFAPKVALVLRAGAPVMAPAKLHAELTMQGASPPARAKLAVEGNLGKVRLALTGETSGDLIALKAGDVQLAGKLSADDGKLLVAMLGLDRIVAADSGPGALTFDASGPMRGALRVSAALKAGGLQANATGSASLFADNPSATLRAAVVHADIAPLRGAGAGQAALPITFAGRIALAGKDLALDDIEATVAGTALRGKLGLTLATPHRLRGEIDADRVDGAGVIAAAIGMPARAESKSAVWHWSDEPFTAGIFGDYAGRIAFKTRSLDVLPQLAAREFGATLNFGRQEISLDGMTGDVAGGRLTGSLSFHAAEDGLHARGKFALAGADVSALLAVGCAAAGDRDARAVGRGGRRRAKPGRADRLAARFGTIHAQRRAIRRARSARLRCRHPCRRSGAGDRCGAHLRRGEQGAAERASRGQTRARRSGRQRRASAARQVQRRQQRGAIVGRRQSRSHRRHDRWTAGALGSGRAGRLAARHFHGAEGPADGAGAHARRLGADRLAHSAGDRKPDEAIARNRTGAAAAAAVASAEK